MSYEDHDDARDSMYLEMAKEADKRHGKQHRLGVLLNAAMYVYSIDLQHMTKDDAWEQLSEVDQAVRRQAARKRAAAEAADLVERCEGYT